MPKKAASPIRVPSAKSGDQPATRKMLSLVRDELRSEIRASRQEMESRFQGMESRFQGIESKFQGIDSRFLGIDSRFQDMESKFQKIDSRFEEVNGRLIRMELLLEEQNANNRIVLEGLQALWQRQVRLEEQAVR